MIICRSPLRISLGGGGTDLPSYYREHGGFLIAGAINKYVYVTLHRSFLDEILLRYSRIERVKKNSEIEHPIVRECLNYLSINEPHLEMTSIADVPAGTGLGSSGSFTTALIKALHKFKNDTVSSETLAQQACHIEINVLKEPIGKQDQYAAAYGGIRCYEFLKDDRVNVSILRISEDATWELNDRLLLFSTGKTRSASEILKEQKQRTEELDQKMIDNLHRVKDIGYRSREALETENLDAFGQLMHEHWLYKKERSSSMSDSRIDKLYTIGLENGALGGKLIGAGGGGFLMFYATDPMRLRKAMAAEGVTEMRIRFEPEGTRFLL